MNRRSQSYLVNFVFSVSVFSLAISPVAFAVTSTEPSYYNFYKSNNIIFYDPNATPPCSGAGTPIVTTSKQALENLKQAYAYFIGRGLQDFQAAGIIGNIQTESGGYTNQLENSPPGRGPASPSGVNTGWGLVQWTPGSKFLDIQKAAGVSGSPADLQTQLDTIWWSVTNSNQWFDGNTISNLKSTSDVASATRMWMTDFEHPSSYASLQNRINFAQVALSTFPKTTGGSSPTTVTTAGCSDSSSGVVQGNIVQTAEGFAWNQPVANTSGNWKSSAKPSYVNAVQQYNPSVLPGGPPPEEPYADCGIFVSTVMIASGVDKNYPSVGTIAQMKYVESHPNKYQIINNPQMSALQPGDILIVNNSTDNHTMIYTGQIGTDSSTGAKLIAIDASEAQRPPSYRTVGDVQWMLSRPGVVAVRVK